jgi:hypothetical protein
MIIGKIFKVFREISLIALACLMVAALIALI